MIKTKPILPPKTEFKSFHFERKSIDEDQGIITGYLSTFGNVDLQNDRVAKGAFSKTITEGKSRMQTRGLIWPALWFHNPEQPIGKVVDVEEDDKGLLITAQLDIATNSQGIPNNPLAVMAFSGFKSGFVSELSMGYIAIQKDYDKQGVRNLKECAIVEASAVTALFAANPDALVSAAGVKSMQGVQSKTVCGNTNFPLTSKDTEWDGGKADKQIVEWITKDNGDYDFGKLQKICFYYDADVISSSDATQAQKLSDHKLPYCYIENGKPQICVQRVFDIAGVLNGAHGGLKGVSDADIASIKKKVTTLYNRIAKAENDDTIKAPFGDDEKRRTMNGQERKDFNDLYQSTMAADCLEDWGDLINTLTQAMMQLFSMGDQPQEDMTACLEQFGKAVMEWTEKGVTCDLAEYISDRYVENYAPYVPYSLRAGSDCGYMTRSKRPDGKVGARISSATQQTLEDHQKCLHGFKCALTKMASEIGQKASDLTQLWQEEGQGEPYGNDDDSNDGKSLARREPPPALTREDQPLHKSTEDDLNWLLG